MRKDLVLGFDIGGTSTRALLATIDGQRLGTGHSGGANPTTHGFDASLATIAEAARMALTGHDPARVIATHLGIAGGEPYEQPDGRTRLAAQWTDLGIGGGITHGPDLTVAFAAGTDAVDGTIAIGGTGAIAARVRRWEMVNRGDGYGWLLGDEGSGFWLGRQAARETLYAVDGHRPVGPLVEAVLADLWHQTDEPTTRRLVDILTKRRPIELASYARLVTAAAEIGDARADAILTEAARLLTATITSVRQVGEDTPIVLGGSLLTLDTPVGVYVRERLGEVFPGAPVRTAADGAAGAAWLAARLHVDDPAAVHRALLGE